MLSVKKETCEVLHSPLQMNQTATQHMSMRAISGIYTPLLNI